jgi:uncharacterized protein (TIGR03066 family)
MRTVSVAVAACAVLLGVAAATPVRAADKNKDLIVGKWRAEKDGAVMTVEFTKDGAMKLNAEKGGQKINFDGKYKFVDDDNIEVEMTFMGQTKKEKNKVAINKDELTLTDPEGKVETFKKVAK